MICRKKRKLEKQNSMEYMDQSDDRLKPEGELPAAHSPIPSSLRAVGCWEKADLGDKEASSAGPLPPPTARRLQSRERSSQGRTPGMADPSVEAVAGPRLPAGKQGVQVLAGGKGSGPAPAAPFFALCSRHPPTKWRTGTEEPRGTLCPERQGKQLRAKCPTNTPSVPAMFWCYRSPAMLASLSRTQNNPEKYFCHPHFRDEKNRVKIILPYYIIFV